MVVAFFPTIYNFSYDGETILSQFILVTFALSLIFIACRTMRVVENRYVRTSKKISELKAKMDIVLAQHEPVCRKILLHKVVRYRHSLIAGYLKDLLDENQFQLDNCSNFFNDFPKTASNKRNFLCPTGPSENTVPELQTIKTPAPLSSFDKLIRCRKSSIFRNNCNGEENKAKEARKNEFLSVKSPLESKIFKTLEGPNKRLRSSFVEKRKSKIPKWNIMGLGNDRCSRNFTVCTAVTHTKSPFKIKSSVKNCSQKINLNIKSNYAKQNPEVLTSKVTFNVKGQESPKENQDKKVHVENDKSAGDVPNVEENVSNCSVESSGFDSDSDTDTCLDQSSQATFSNENARQSSSLATIHEESAEENCHTE